MNIKDEDLPTMLAHTPLTTALALEDRMFTYDQYRAAQRAAIEKWANEHAMPKEPNSTMLDALRTGSRKDWPSDELCRVRYAALLAVIDQQRTKHGVGNE